MNSNSGTTNGSKRSRVDVSDPETEPAYKKSRRKSTSSEAPSLPEDNSSPYGIKVLYNPPMGSAINIVDIVAIHDLDGHRERSWTTDPIHASGVLWLKTLLPQDIRNIRVLSFGYDAATHGRRDLSNNALFSHAQDLAARLTLFRKEPLVVRRPIIFLAHGVGGLLLKLALLEVFRAHNGHLPDYLDIKLSTYGILFFGTPHQGFAASTLSRAVHRIESWFTNTNDRILAHLNQGSEYLQDLLAMFTPISGYFDSTYLYSITDLTVPKSSAVVPGAQNTGVIGLNRNHADMVTFGTTLDGDYQVILAILKNLLAKAPEAVEAQWATNTLGANASLKSIALRMESNVDDLVDLERRRHLDTMLSPQAIYDSSDLTHITCVPGTRMSIIDKIVDWAVKPSDYNIFWLTGLAGTGKSTIAKTIASQFPINNTILAFFCSRQVPVARRRQNVIPTIVSLLARAVSSFRHALLKKDYRPVSTRPDLHLRNLLLEPWLASAPERADGLPDILIVIDALDELDAEDALSAGGKLVKQLIEHAKDMRGLKILITSRPEPEVEEECQALREVFRLETIRPEDATQDIQTYLENQLPRLVGSPGLATLTVQCDGLFIYAATAARYVAASKSLELQSKRLDRMIQGSPEVVGRTGVDNLYSQILTTLPTDEELREVALEVLHTILCAQEPLNLASLSRLLGRDDETVIESVGHFHAVVRVDTVTKCLLTYHKSFPEFMSSSNRCGADFIHIPQIQHSRLALQCFGMMSVGLMFNICDLPSSYLLDDEVPMLRERVNQRIDAVLRYSCRYWATHFSFAAGGLSSDLVETLRWFCQHRLMFWIEAMNLIQRRSECAGALQQAANALQEDTLLKTDLSTAEQIATVFASNQVSQSTPHLYMSLLAAVNPDSVFIRHWRAYFTDLPLLKGFHREPILLSSFPIPTRIRCFAISPDGRSVVYSFNFKELDICDLYVGQKLHTLTGHEHLISLAFSPDGRYVVGGSHDGPIYIWDLHEAHGATNPRILRGHSHAVVSVMYFPSGKLLVSGSSLGGVLVWDSVGGELVLHLDEVRGILQEVAVSPDEMCIAVATSSELFVSGVATKAEVLRVSGARCLAFSPDGHLLLSSNQSRTALVLWNTSTGQRLESWESSGGTVWRCSFSPDARHVLVIMEGSEVCLLDAQLRPKAQLIPGGQLSYGEQALAAFSSGGQRIVTYVYKIQVWDVARKLDDYSRLAKGSRVRSVTFSSSGRHIVTALVDGTARVWDVETGHCLHDLDGCKSLVISPDGCCLSFGVGEHIIQVREVTSCKVSVIFLPQALQCAALRADGQTIWYGCQDDGVIRAIESRHGGETSRLEGHTDTVLSCSLSLDGGRLVSSSRDGTIRVWNLNAKVQELRIESEVELSRYSKLWRTAAFAPDDRTIVVTYGNVAALSLDSSTGQPLGEYLNTVKIGHFLCYSPDGTHGLTHSQYDQSVCHATGPQVLRLQHESPVWCASYSLCGQFVATGTQEGIVRVWDVASNPVRDIPFSFENLKDSDTWTGENGWLLSSLGNRLMWLFPDDHAILQHPRCKLLISDMGKMQIQAKKVRVGTCWAETYIGRSQLLTK